MSLNPLSSRAAPLTVSVAPRAKWRSYYQLTKPRLSLLSVITALVGYMVADPVRDLSTLFSLIIGTSLAAGGAGTLNQWIERDADAKMPRTQHRPLPAETVSSMAALCFGLAISSSGVLIIAWGSHLLAALLTVVTLVSYLGVYTPLKLKTPWCTHVGAIPGALPPLIGWTAARDSFGPLGWVLFAILLAWQIPHFMALAWTYRHDYAEGLFPITTVVDPSGQSAAWQSLGFTAVMFAASLVPVGLGLATWLYGGAALLSGLYFLIRAWAFVHQENRDQAARRLFFTSIGYLPLLLAVLVVDHWLLA